MRSWSVVVCEKCGVCTVFVCTCLFCVYKKGEDQRGYTSPTHFLKYSKAGLGIPGENVIDDVPTLKKLILQKKLSF